MFAWWSEAVELVGGLALIPLGAWFVAIDACPPHSFDCVSGWPTLLGGLLVVLGLLMASHAGYRWSHG